MNLGGLFSGLGSAGGGGVKGLLGKNRTILIILVVIIVIFGFGYGRGLFGGLGSQGAGRYGAAAAAYGNFGDYGYMDPRRRKKSKHHRHHHGRANAAFEYAEYDYAAPYGGYSAYGAGYGSGRGGFFGNDWFFIIAIIALLFLLSESAEEKTNTEASNVNVC
jgi:hypothetical protein